MINTANATRRHNGAVRAWADMARATSTVPVVLGDKDNEALTKTYNDGHVSDIVEPGAGVGLRTVRLRRLAHRALTG